MGFQWFRGLQFTGLGGLWVGGDRVQGFGSLGFRDLRRRSLGFRGLRHKPPKP